MDSYTQGFMDKCAGRGDQLIKLVQRGVKSPVKGTHSRISSINKLLQEVPEHVTKRNFKGGPGGIRYGWKDGPPLDGSQYLMKLIRDLRTKTRATPESQFLNKLKGVIPKELM